MKKNTYTIPKLALLITALVFSTAIFGGPAVGSYTWNGSASNQWDLPANWTLTSGTAQTLQLPINIPNSDYDVIIPAGTPFSPVISNAIFSAAFSQVHNLRVNADATLTLTGKEIHLYGTDLFGGVNAYGIISGNRACHIVSSVSNYTVSGKLQIDEFNPETYTSGIVNGSCIIMRKLDLGGHVNVGNGGELIFRSTSSSQSAILDNFNYTGTNLTQSGTGVIKVERFIPSPTGYHRIGSPIAMNLDQFGATGSGPYIPYFPPVPGGLCDENVAVSAPGTVWSYDESNPLNTSCYQYAWTALGPGNAANPGVGYTAKLTAGVHTFIGLPNQADSYTLTGLKNSNWTNETVQSISQPFNIVSGWHLLANPFLAPLNMAATLSSNPGFDDACVYDESGIYRPLIIPAIYNFSNSGVVNAGYLAPFQAVMVHRGLGAPVTQTPTLLGSASFTFDKNNCAATQSPVFYKQTNGAGLAIQVTGNGHTDYTYCGYSSDATSDFEVGFDSRKITSDAGVPTLYTKNNDVFMAINTYHSIEETPSIDLGIWPGVNGNFTLTFAGIDNFDISTVIILEDKANGQLTDLRANNNYSFTQTLADNPDRFVIHFSELVISGVNHVAADQFKMFSSGNTLYVDFSNMENVNATIDIYNVLGQQISSEKFGSSGIYSKLMSSFTGYVMVKTVNGGVVRTGKFFIK